MPLNLEAGYLVNTVLQYSIFKEHYKQQGAYWSELVIFKSALNRVKVKQTYSCPKDKQQLAVKKKKKYNDNLKRRKNSELQQALEVSTTLYRLISKPVVFLTENCDFHPISVTYPWPETSPNNKIHFVSYDPDL